MPEFNSDVALYQILSSSKEMTNSTQSIQSHHQMWPGCSEDSPADVCASSCPPEKESSIPQWTSWQISGGIYRPASKWRPALPWVWQQAARQTRSPTFFYHWDGAVGRKKKKKASGSHPVCFLLFKCLSGADGGLQSSISLKKREGEDAGAKGCLVKCVSRLWRDLDCIQILLWHFQVQPFHPEADSHRSLYIRYLKKTEDVHSGSNYWIKHPLNWFCKLVKYVSPSNVLFRMSSH